MRPKHLQQRLEQPAKLVGPGRRGSTSMSISDQTRSASPSSSSALLRKCQYSAIGVTPSS